MAWPKLFFLSFSILLGSVSISYSLRDLKNLNERWYYTGILRANGTLDAARIGYSRLYGELNHNSKFLLDYAKCLTSQQKKSDANKILDRALLICNDPMLHNIRGCNFQDMGDFLEAENSFNLSVNVLPGRIYPYYLLAKLYMKLDFLDKEKAGNMASIVLTKTPKVYSKSIDEMRLEMKALLDTLIIN